MVSVLWTARHDVQHPGRETVINQMVFPILKKRTCYTISRRLFWSVFLRLKMSGAVAHLFQRLSAMGAERGGYIMLIHTCFLWDFEYIRPNPIVIKLFFWTGKIHLLSPIFIFKVPSIQLVFLQGLSFYVLPDNRMRIISIFIELSRSRASNIYDDIPLWKNMWPA